MKKLLMIPHLMEIYLPLKKKKGKDTNGEDSVDESYTSKKKISRVTPFQDYLKILRQVLEL